MENYSFKIVRFDGKEKEETFHTSNKEEVLNRLASDLYSKKLCNCSYIKSIKRIQHYTHVELIVTYDNDFKCFYTLPAHF